MNIQFKKIGAEVLDGLNMIPLLNCDLKNGLERYWFDLYSNLIKSPFDDDEEMIGRICDKIILKSSIDTNQSSILELSKDNGGVIVIFNTKYRSTKLEITIYKSEGSESTLDVSILFSSDDEDKGRVKFLHSTFDVYPGFAQLAAKILSYIQASTKKHGLKICINEYEFSLVKAVNEFHRIKEEDRKRFNQDNEEVYTANLGL